jgi:hypothetical protein
MMAQYGRNIKTFVIILNKICARLHIFFYVVYIKSSVHLYLPMIRFYNRDGSVYVLCKFRAEPNEKGDSLSC